MNTLTDEKIMIRQRGAEWESNKKNYDRETREEKIIIILISLIIMETSIHQF